MNEAQRQLIRMLNIELFNANIDDLIIDSSLVADIWKEAEAHILGALCYCVIKKSEIQNPLEKIMISHSIFHSIQQIQYFHNIIKVFYLLTSNNIKVVILKGAQLRFLYPNPEYRTMSDIDILVSQGDFSKVKELLFQQGFTGNVDNGVHLQFIKKDYMPLEVHWRLINTNYIKKGSEAFEQRIWKNIEQFTEYQVPLYVLGKEDNLIYLLLHLTEHFISSGFGLRQICDVGLFLKNNDLAWEKVLFFAKSLDIEKFLLSILSVCMSLFHIDVPDFVKKFKKQNAKYVDMLIDEILDSGVYGNKNSTRVMAKLFTQYSINENIYNIKIFFPGLKKLYEEFPYLTRSKPLIPIAWIHRSIKIITKKLNTFIQVNKVRASSGELLSVKKAYRQRVNIIKWINRK